MKATWVLILSIVIGCVCTQAQTGTSAQSKAATTSDAPSREEVMKLLELMRAKRNMVVAMEGYLNAAKQGFRQTFTERFPDATPEQLALADAVWGEIFKDVSYDELLDRVVSIYERHLTKQDVAAMTAFYSSTAGQKLLNEMPAIMQESMQAGADYMSDKLKPALARVDEHMKKLMESMAASAEKAPKSTPSSEIVPKNQSPKK